MRSAVELLPAEQRRLLKWKMSTVTPNVVKHTIARSHFKVTKSKSSHVCRSEFPFATQGSQTGKSQRGLTMIGKVCDIHSKKVWLRCEMSKQKHNDDDPFSTNIQSMFKLISFIDFCKYILILSDVTVSEVKVQYS